jgi:hypothetical protein
LCDAIPLGTILSVLGEQQSVLSGSPVPVSQSWVEIVLVPFSALPGVPRAEILGNLGPVSRSDLSDEPNELGIFVGGEL